MITQQQKDSACDCVVTLNGRLAKVSGRLEQFATVSDIESGVSFQWSWESAIRIAETKGGAFHTLSDSDRKRIQRNANRRAENAILRELCGTSARAAREDMGL